MTLAYRILCKNTTFMCGKGVLTDTAIVRIDYALAKIAQWFENDRYKNVARTRMRAAGASYVRYRAARCAYLAALHGDARDISRLACLARKNLQRARELARGTDAVSSE
ncbi:DUF1311 domain-containing protein [Massilia violaceinigra]|uniref:DUF1311 domain-containing protein n=1 Tax=Massilia violaceinigra TaxID=2045208 RepID=A0ABY4A6H9_9BURK|nr:lysozyme inhibitor LprI family protein [Massilia violaceinigra]UOD28253.1 DUF1311 domain-containing protein [Massilia violaceinigra]